MEDNRIWTEFSSLEDFYWGFPGGTSGKEPACHKKCGCNPWAGKIPWRKAWAWQPTPVFLPGESHGQRGLAGCGRWGHPESGTTESAHV